MKKYASELLTDLLEAVKKAGDIFNYSYTCCIDIVNQETYTYEDLDKLEALTSRYARLSDLIIQKMLRLIVSLELEEQGTVRDRITLAEKWGLIESAEEFALMRELRNTIAHEYEPEAIREIYKAVIRFAPVLLNAVESIRVYCRKFL